MGNRSDFYQEADTAAFIQAGFVKAPTARVATATIAAAANTTFTTYVPVAGKAYELTAGQNAQEVTPSATAPDNYLTIELPDGTATAITWNWKTGPYRFIADTDQVTIQVNNPTEGTPVIVTIREMDP